MPPIQADQELFLLNIGRKMAHFAEIDSSNTVIRVIVIDDEYQSEGEAYCQNLLNSTNRWLQTSYNTLYNEHLKGGTPFRKNFAGIGFTYNETIDGFVPPKKFESWILDEEKGIWKAPVAFPGFLPNGTMNKSIQWNEKILNWSIIDDPLPKDVPRNHVAVFNEQECRWDIIKQI